MTEKYTVYKAVSKTADPRVFTSFVVDGEAMLTYEIGKETTNNTPIFVYLSEDQALECIDVNTVVIRGTTTTHPIYPPTNKILNLAVAKGTRREIEKFWQDYWRNAGELRWENKLLRFGDTKMRFVYNFTPEEVITYEDE
jgi:hypothetical protein